ncbi:MAG: type II secretion system F family protein [Thermodesulfobacteriota bacterium]
MDLLDILLYISVLLPFALLIVWQIKRPWLGQRKTIQRLKKRIGLPVTIVNRPAAARKKPVARLLDWLKHYILQAGVAEEKMNTVFICGLTLAGLGILLMILPVKLGPVVQFAAVLLPFVVPLFILINMVRRRQLFVRQLPDAIDAIIRSLSAGSSINQAISMISSDFPDPIGYEFKQISRQIEHGLPFKEVMNGFRRRLSIAEVHYLAMALIVHRETGGQLIKILEQLTGIIRRRAAFNGKLKAVTAEPRFTAYFFVGLSVFLISARFFLHPQSMVFFLHDPTGLFLFKICLALIITGLILLKYMARITF